MSLLDALAPPLCLSCRAPLARPARGPALCVWCESEIERTPGRALGADGIDAGFAALPYSGAGRNLVAALKFSRLLIAAELGAALIASRCPGRILRGTMVPVPPAPHRLARRGFDPAAELARNLGGLTGLETAVLLRRCDLSRQRGRERRERLARPPRISAARASPEDVLIVDDVVTTGATLDACARALRLAGATRVRAVALAAVEPPPRPRRGLARGDPLGVE